MLDYGPIMEQEPIAPLTHAELVDDAEIALRAPQCPQEPVAGQRCRSPEANVVAAPEDAVEDAVESSTSCTVCSYSYMRASVTSCTVVIMIGPCHMAWS